MNTENREDVAVKVNSKAVAPDRDLNSEKQAVEAAIAKQSASTREYLSGKFKIS